MQCKHHSDLKKQNKTCNHISHTNRGLMGVDKTCDKTTQKKVRGLIWWGGLKFSFYNHHIGGILENAQYWERVCKEGRMAAFLECIFRTASFLFCRRFKILSVERGNRAKSIFFSSCLAKRYACFQAPKLLFPYISRGRDAHTCTPQAFPQSPIIHHHLCP